MSGVAPERLLQITDTHLLSAPGATLLGVDTGATLAAVLEQALAEAEPDAILASGDLAHDPVTESYDRFSRIVAERYRGPVLHLPGNHDLGDAMSPLLGPAALVLDDWEVIGFDTHRDHRTEAALDPADRQALTGRIEASRARYLLLACHHHPLPVGCPWLDKDCIPGGRELLESCAAHERVRGLVFGHVHQAVDTRHERLAVLGTPSTCFQFEPGSRSFAIDRSDPGGRPGYRWLILHPDGTLESEVRRLSGPPLHIDLSDRS